MARTELQKLRDQIGDTASPYKFSDEILEDAIGDAESVLMEIYEITPDTPLKLKLVRLMAGVDLLTTKPSNAILEKSKYIASISEGGSSISYSNPDLTTSTQVVQVWKKDIEDILFKLQDIIYLDYGNYGDWSG